MSIIFLPGALSFLRPFAMLTFPISVSSDMCVGCISPPDIISRGLIMNSLSAASFPADSVTFLYAELSSGFRLCSPCASETAKSAAEFLMSDSQNEVMLLPLLPSMLAAVS